jgi:hypothetical protein
VTIVLDVAATENGVLCTRPAAGPGFVGGEEEVPLQQVATSLGVGVQTCLATPEVKAVRLLLMRINTVVLMNPLWEALRGVPRVSDVHVCATQGEFHSGWVPSVLSTCGEWGHWGDDFNLVLHEVETVKLLKDFKKQGDGFGLLKGGLWEGVTHEHLVWARGVPLDLGGNEECRRVS